MTTTLCVLIFLASVTVGILAMARVTGTDYPTGERVHHEELDVWGPLT